MPAIPDSRHKVCWPAPAKLNLMLHITGRRADGYHELQTVFQFLSVTDSLTFQVRDDRRIVVEGNAPGIATEDDLIYRAARLLQQETACERGVTIRIDKKLPMGAGLGGGSSDAATCLLALNHYWQRHCTLDQLAGYGLTLGADVPVFIKGFSAFAEGVGERLTPLELPLDWFVVLVPPVHVSTAEIFCNPQLTRDCSAIKICDLSRQSWQNVCTPVVTRHYPEVAQAIDWLGAFSTARMSGTGAAVYAAFDHREAAQAAYRSLQKRPLPEGWRCFVTQGQNRSPLHTMMQRLEQTDARV